MPRTALLALLSLFAGCTRQLTLDPPLGLDAIAAKVAAPDVQVDRVADDRLEVTAVDPAGALAADVEALFVREEQLTKLGTLGKAARRATAEGKRQRVLALEVRDGGRHLEFHRSQRTAFPEAARGLSGIPIGGGSVDSPVTEADRVWFEAREQELGRRLGAR